MENVHYTWTGFYEKFADTLLTFKNDRDALIDKIQSAYKSINMKLPKLDSTPRPSDIDPFTVFGLFNKGITDANRRRIVDALAHELGIEAERPEDYDGVPLINNLNATFYAFTGGDRRGERDIDNLWSIFEMGMELASDDNPKARGSFCSAFDRATIQFGIKWRLTTGLFWVRPNFFVSLDQRSRWFMGNMKKTGVTLSGIVPKEHATQIPDGSTYLDICEAIRSRLGTEECPYRSLPALSDAAFKESERVNEEKKAEAANSAQPTHDALGDDDVETVRYWLYAPGPNARMWDDFYEHSMMGIRWGELGDLSAYSSKEEMRQRLQEARANGSSQKNAALATWQFVHEVKQGDVIFVKQGSTKILGRGVVAGDYVYDPDNGEFPNLREVRWTHQGEWTSKKKLATKTLTDITAYTDLVETLCSFFEEIDETDDDLEDAPITVYPPYDRESFLSEVYMDGDAYDALANVLRAKKNVILQGAPGVGKTFAAKRLAYSMIGTKDIGRVMMVQFHQSYSYEDFIEGYRPSQNGFELTKGSFYTLCKRAADDFDHDYFFIIDEINRGNLSKIFGELFMLIESDKRGPRNKLQLLYSHEQFYVPDNVYLIGMMNTADRSLALLDYALRRRFAFFDLRPAFSTDGFIAYRDGLGSSAFNRIIDCIIALNEDIASDESLGEGFCIGHSYFCHLKPGDEIESSLSAIVEYELVPLLREYWFDEPAKARDWADRLRRAIS